MGGSILLVFKLLFDRRTIHSMKVTLMAQRSRVIYTMTPEVGVSGSVLLGGSMNCAASMEVYGGSGKLRACRSETHTLWLHNERPRGICLSPKVCGAFLNKAQRMVREGLRGWKLVSSGVSWHAGKPEGNSGHE